MNTYESYINEIIDMSIDILNTILKNGYIALNNYFDDKSSGLDKNVYKLYIKGINLMTSGRSPEQLELLLEMEKIQLIDEASLSTENILLITIIQRLIPCMQTLNLELFSDLCQCILSKDKFNELQIYIQDMKAYIDNINSNTP